MQGATHATTPAVAAFFMALMVSCFAFPYEECLEHQLVPDAAINNAVLALTKGEHSTDGSVFEKWSSGPLIVNVTSWHSNIENALQPFTRSCEGGDTTVDAEFEVSWVVSAQMCVGGKEEDVLGAVDVVLRSSGGEGAVPVEHVFCKRNFHAAPTGCAGDVARNCLGERLQRRSWILRGTRGRSRQPAC
ncbi:uncharacterized protein LOC125946548 [Dermacentor silvarum]|uniref:uncharacterized protein LOC125946548 n=1 Tax=Dermacentor silvarum TaxID=543639 RepID=UPI00210153BC|nr:uncharacterized protein LOC125946548 [Dermacentor silvarum]